MNPSAPGDGTDDRLAAIRRAISDRNLPPVHTWQPAKSGDIDIRILANGDWHYQGSKIERLRLVKLFASILRIDDEGQPWLVTPLEQLRIRIDDAPFTAVSLSCYHSETSPVLVFTTNLGDQVIADRDHPVVVHYGESPAGSVDHDAEPRPYVRVRDRLNALLTRSVFIELAEHAVVRDGVYGVYSSGSFMPLGPV